MYLYGITIYKFKKPILVSALIIWWVDMFRNVDAAAGIRSTGADPADDEQELFNPR